MQDIVSPSQPEDTRRATHDLGGASAFMCESIDKEPHALTAFDRDVDALSGLLRAQGMLTVDEQRRGVEAIPETDYHRLSYYQRWIRSIAATLINRGVLSEAEIAAALAEL